MTDTAATGDEHEKEYRIVVNGEPKVVRSDVVTFDEAVRLAYGKIEPDTLYSITFEKAEKPTEGELRKGEHVIVKDGTEFDVERTGKS